MLQIVLVAACSTIYAEETINDDVSVVGVMEVGPAANTTNFFGTDLLRLSGERVRLKFIDTSPSGTRNDWRIRINNGGGNINGFFIDDMGTNNRDGAENGHVATPFRIEAGAREDSLVVSDVPKQGNTGSRIGMGTKDPLSPLHIVNAATPAIRLERTDENFAPYTWAVGGAFPNFFVRDVVEGRNPVLVQAGAPENSLVVSGSFAPRVGIGTDQPAAHVHLKGSTPEIRWDHNNGSQVWSARGDSFAFAIRDTSNGGQNVLSLKPGAPNASLYVREDGNVGMGTGNPQADLQIGGAFTFSRINAGATTFTASSSRDLKENIRDFDGSQVLKRMQDVRVKTYDWKKQNFAGDEADRTNRLGLIAEEFHQVLGRGSDKEINGQELQSVLWMAVQELHQENQRLKESLAQKEDALESIQSRLVRIESHLQMTADEN